MAATLHANSNYGIFCAGSRGGWHVQIGLAIGRKETVMNKHAWMLGVLLACHSPALAQHSAVIESFDSTGQLTFSPMPNAASYRVEWAPSANGPWTNFTGGYGQFLDQIVAAGAEPITVSVPMLYRVVATMAPEGMVFVQGGTLPDIGHGELNVSTFYMDKYETTKALWDEVYAWAITNGYAFDNTGSGCASNHPVHTVNWYDAVKWCNARSQMEGRQPVYTVNGAVYKAGQSNDVVQTTAVGYRMPTDAEWEFAARGGTQSQGCEYSGGNDVGAVAWYWDNSGGAACDYWGTGRSTWPVGQKDANELGIHDMSGNAWEWCFDWDPESEGSGRVIRGGGWYYLAGYCRVGGRNNANPDGAINYLGFRAVLSPARQVCRMAACRPG
jgi:formylglycine-generating enzyme